MKENFEFTNFQGPEKDADDENPPDNIEDMNEDSNDRRDSDNQSDEQKRESRYVCYVDKIKTLRVTELPTEGMIDYSMREMMRDKVIPPKEELEKIGYKENPEFIKNNDIFSKKGSAEVRDTLRHELIHSVTKAKYLLRATSEASFEEKELAFGYAIGKYLANFNEGLTELTNLQISLECEGSYSGIVGYINNVIFISELAKDMTNKINSNPDILRYLVAFYPNWRMPVTQRDLLAHLQIGMFNGNPKYLRIISDIYDDKSKKINALKTLAEMGKYKEEMLKTAKAFGLEDAISKINDCHDGNEVEINIGEFSIKINERMQGDE